MIALGLDPLANANFNKRGAAPERPPPLFFIFRTWKIIGVV